MIIYRHQFTLFLALDGNYRLNQVAKHCDPKDKSLNNGNAYFVNEDQFQDFLKLHDDASTHVSPISFYL